MASRVGYSITSFSHKGAITLEIDGSEYEVVNVTVSYAVNTIPMASCVIAVGRNMRKLEQKARIHLTAGDLRQLRPAKIWIEPRGDYDSSGKQWPKGRRLLFEGKFCGIGSKQASNSLGIVLHFKHWLMDLASSSALAGGLARSFPMSLVGPAVAIGGGGATQRQAANISEHVNHLILNSELETDVWTAVKAMLVETCLENRLAFFSTPPGLSEATALRSNKIGLSALDRIEGVYQSETDEKSHGLEYKYGAPIALSSAAKKMAVIAEELSAFISGQPLASFSSNSLWEVLILQLFGPLGLVMIPTPDRAVVAVDTSLLSQISETIYPTHLLGIDDMAMLDVPLKAVGVFGDSMTVTGAAADGINETTVPIFGGMFVDETIPEDVGTLLTAPSPFWLRRLAVSGQYAKTNLGKGGRAIKTADQPAVAMEKDEDPPAKLADDGQDLYNAYAQMLWANHALRGMDGGFLSPLRFDLAPGRLVRVSRQFLENARDDLAVDKIGYIHTVTLSIDAQGRQAGTAFKLSHLRTEADNDRGMALESHPLYDASAYKGAPLIDFFGA